MRLLEIIFGRRLANREQRDQKLGWFEAIPAMGLDGLGSSSYGPEAALAVLAPAGYAATVVIGWVIAPVVALLGILYFSYRQTIVAYPRNGGAYTVAKENLGPAAAILAATALMIDYVLNVAVGISAGVGALTSSVPALQPWTLELCLGILLLLGITNLRGTREAGWLFALPTYLFLACFLSVIGVGIVRVLSGSAAPLVAPAPIKAGEALSLWILLRAFAAGCTAMTGIEAVSNGVDALKPPVVPQAHRTLTGICLALGLLLAGVAALSHYYHVGAMDQTQPGYHSLLSQLAGAVVGQGAIYYLAMASLLAVLCLSANTSFVGFPRLCRLLARDDYLPRSFALLDRRLVYSVGVIFLTMTGGGLLILFGGITDSLIPLFAVGAFLTFTMSQLGMVAHWRCEGRRQWKRLALNAVGAAATIIALLIIVSAKFGEGAWITVVAIPISMAVLFAVRRYYDRLTRRMDAAGAITVDETQPPTVLVAYEGRSRMTDRALRFAMTLSPDVVAVHLLRLGGPDEADDVTMLKEEFERDICAPLRREGLTPPRLVAVPAPYRDIEGPILEMVDKIDAETPGRSVAILIPELVLRHWWERVLHSRRAARLRMALLRHAGPRLMVVTCPFWTWADDHGPGSRMNASSAA